MGKVLNLEKNDTSTVYFRQIRVYDLLREILHRFRDHQSYDEQKEEVCDIVSQLGKLSLDVNLKEPILTYKSRKEDKLINLTPLQAACAILDVQIVEVLLDNMGAVHLGVNLQDRNGNTALHWMHQYHKKNEISQKLEELLISHGADINIKNKLGQTAEEISQSK